MGSRALFVVCIFICSFSNLSANNWATNKPFRGLLHQVEKQYLVRNGWLPSKFIKDHPDAIAAMIGNAAFQQMPHASDGQEGRRRINSLMTQAKAYFVDLARAAHYSTKDGKRISADSLFKDSVYYARGEGQDTIAQTMNVFPGQVPDVFVQGNVTIRPKLLSLVGSQKLKPRVARTKRISRLTKAGTQKPQTMTSKPKPRAIKPRPKAAKTAAKPKKVLPEGRVFFVGKAPGSSPPSYFVEVDTAAQKAVSKLTQTGHSQIVFGPATFDECCTWIEKTSPVDGKSFYVGKDDYLTPARFTVLKASSPKKAKATVMQRGFTDIVCGPATQKRCWEFVITKRLKHTSRP